MTSRPTWQWWKMDADHWVAYPDEVIAVVDMPTGHLEGVLKYLAGWDRLRVTKFIFAWENRAAQGGPTTDEGERCIGIEIEGRLHLTHREWLEQLLVPCLRNLEAEAQKRGISVPLIPSYDEPPPAEVSTQ
jgi:hypothetical protein